MTHFKHLSKQTLLAGLLLAAAPVVFAQTDNTAGEADPNTGEVTENVPVEEETLVGEGEPVKGQILLQTENTILADDLIGQSVYSPDDEEVGEINDLIISFDGSVEGAVVGVGGFLGIGEKEVAIELQSIELIPMEDDNVRLVVATTREELEAAPGFASKWTQDVAEEAEEAEEARRSMAQDPGVGVAGPLPSDELAPATDDTAQ